MQDVCPVSVLSGLSVEPFFEDALLSCESWRLLRFIFSNLRGSGHIFMVLSYEPVTNLLLGSVTIDLIPPIWHWKLPMFSKVVISNIFTAPSSEPVMIFLSGSFNTTYTVREWFLHQNRSTDENEADLAIFLTAVGEMFGSGSIIAFGLISFELLITVLPLLLWRVIRRGPAWDNLF